MSDRSKSSGDDKSPAFLDKPQVRHMTSLSNSTLYALMKEGKFPRNVKVGARSVRWIQKEVEGWIAARIAESRQTNLTGGR